MLSSGEAFPLADEMDKNNLFGLKDAARRFGGEKKKRRQRRGARARGRPTQARSEQRNRELLERALDLFLERGFAHTTIEAIVDSLGMARRTLYARYGDKITLFKAALQRAIDDLVIPIEQLRDMETDDLEATLLNVATQILARMGSPEGMRLKRIATAEVFVMPEIAAYLWERTGQIPLTYLTDLFQRRLARESAADAALAFSLLVVEGSFQTRVWLYASDAELNRQMIYRVRLFLEGARAASSARKIVQRGKKRALSKRQRR